MNAPLTCGFRAPGSPPPHGEIATLAFALAQHARTLGLTVVRILASRIRHSASKHLQLRDPRGRLWHIRLSDHPNPAATGYEKPHFDLVTYDGGSGYELAVAFVNKIARNEIAWAAAEPTPRRKGQKMRSGDVSGGALPDVLLPYQQEGIILSDANQLLVVEKSRRTGITYGFAADAVLVAGAQQGGMDGCVLHRLQSGHDP